MVGSKAEAVTLSIKVSRVLELWRQFALEPPNTKKVTTRLNDCIEMKE